MYRKKILIIIPTFPYPARRNGVSIRYFPIIEHLGRTNDVHVVCICNKAFDEIYIKELKKHVSDVSVYVREKVNPNIVSKMKNRIASLVPGRKPYSFRCYDNERIKDFISKRCEGIEFDSTVCVTTQYFDITKRSVNSKKYFIDGIDSSYLHYKRRSGKSILENIDTKALASWESKCLRVAEGASYVSPVDRDQMQSIAGSKASIKLIPNGLYFEDYKDESIVNDKFTLGFLGNMQYDSNIRAALDLYHIFLILRERGFNLKLKIIGRRPVENIRKLAEDNDVEVTGSVSSIWPHINGVDVFVFPMTIGSGQQNKLLEAMYASKPVVTTSLGNSGIGGESFKDLVVADSEEDMVSAIAKIYSDNNLIKKLQTNSKIFVEGMYSWERILKELDRFWLSCD
ncbi:glycosyltransferase [Marinimicrobium agarilyticum]|uniref:glycosyltransferase n=1 Tax=Marinimicrobium agarilyticum TaxID=306546 RepID=UPI000415067A|nr:glycosyltransferase [Marinimicrobium agarilyticum]